MQRSIDEKPYVEILDGRAVPKVSPKRRHGIPQWRIAAQLQELAADRGDVATEWRCWLSDGPRATTLVPDVAFVSAVRLEWKLRAYLRHGCVVAIDVMPDERVLRVFTLDGVRTYREGERYACAELPWLTIDVGDLFSALNR